MSFIISIEATCPDDILFFTLCISSNNSSGFTPLALNGDIKYFSIHLSKSSLLA